MFSATESNPLLAPRGLPRFGAIQVDHVLPALETVLAENRATVERVLTAGRFDWDGLAEPLVEAEDRVHRCWGPVGHLHAVRDEPALREAYNAGLPLLAAYATEIAQNPRLYAAFKALAASAGLTPAQRRWVELELIEFRLGGAELAAAEKQRFAQIQVELSQLGATFSEHVLDATNAFAMVLTDPAEIEGLPPSVVQAAAEAAAQPGAWKFTLHFPSYEPFMRYARSRARRRELYTAYVTRSSSGGLDNGPLIDRILALRREAAGLLGFPHWGARSLVKKMAHTVEEVNDFLLDLARRSRPRALRELAELEAFVRAEGGSLPLEAWDLSYWSERLRQRDYSFSEEDVKAYFPEPAVVDGLFAVVGRLYGITALPRADVETWNPDVCFFDVRDADGTLRGGLYTDLRARPGKREGAWMDEAVVRRRTPEGVELPVAYLNCNFPSPSGGTPALLRHDDVSTLFHEFGHCLHHILTRVDVPGVSGINGVAWDAVELPSQFHEYWVWEREPLSLFARHWQTGEPLPEALFAKMHAARNFQSGMQMLRQIEFALFDMRLHTTFEPGGPVSVQECLDRVRQEVAVVLPPPWNRFQNNFSHVFAGGYSAGYYSYKWAEVLAADAFSKFEERGVFDRATGREFLECILERGGSEDAATLYERFRGRPPTIDALLRHSGITE
ncbi:MAG: M3 family metallopeptidase [Candidatus Binatia bacterium]